MFCYYFKILILFFSAFTCLAQLSVIPYPQEVELLENSVAISQGRIVYANDALEPLALSLSNNLVKVNHIMLPVVKSSTPQANDILIKFTTNLNITNEAYKLTVDTYATLEAENLDALQRATMTILQAIEGDQAQAQLQRMNIKDYPYRDERGLMIDMKNQWHSVADLCKFIKLCQFYKIKHLSLHSGEEQWIGAITEQVADMTASEKASKRFYTKAEMDYIIAYGASNGVYLLPHNESTPHFGGMIDAMTHDFCASDTYAGFPDELDGLGSFADFDGSVSERWLNVMKIAHRKSLEQFGAAYPDGIVPYYHIGPVQGEGGMSSAIAKEIVEMIIEISPKTKVSFWNGIGAYDSNLSPYKDNIQIFYYQQWGGADINGYLDAGWDVVNAAWSPLYILGSIKRTQAQIYDNWNYYRSGNDGSLNWNNITWYDFDNTNYYDQVKGGFMCTWEMSMPDHYDSVKYRLPVYADRAWCHGSTKDFGDISNRFLHTDFAYDRYMMLPEAPGQPLNLAATQGIYSNKVVLSWSYSENNPEQYIIYRNTTDNFSGAQIIGTNALKNIKYIDFAVTNGQDYFYWIQALSFFGQSPISSSTKGYVGTGITLPVAYEGFAYNTGDSIQGKDGGEGWKSSWNITSENGPISVKSTGLTYPGWSTVGGCINLHPLIDGDAGGASVYLNRSINDKFGHDSTEMWGSLMIRPNKKANGHFWISFGDITTGKKWWQGYGFGGGSFILDDDTTYLVIFKAKFMAGDNNDSAFMWINPTLESEPSEAAANETAANINYGLKDNISFNLQSYGTGDYDVDELRVADSWESLINVGKVPEEAPAVPQNVKGSLGDFHDKVVISWDAVPYAQNYALYRYFANNFNDAVLITSNLTQTVFEDFDINAGDRFFYWVKAGNQYGWSDFSHYVEGYIVTNTYNLNVQNGNGSGSYFAGTEVDITANVAPEGQTFDVWSGDTETIQNVAYASTMLVMPSKDATVTATYQDIVLSDAPYEGFEYNIGDMPENKNGGVNWSTAWSRTSGSDGWNSIGEPLAYLDQDDNQLLISGNKVALHPQGDGSAKLKRTFDLDETEFIYFSFLANPATHHGGYDYSFNLGSDTGDSVLLIARGWGSQNWMIAGFGDTRPAALPLPAVGATQLMVGKIALAAGTCDFWSNPNLAMPGEPDYTQVGYNFNKHNFIELYQQANSTIGGSVTNTFDEIRIGLSWHDVVPISTPKNPTLAAYYNMDEIDGTTMLDQSHHEFDGAYLDNPSLGVPSADLLWFNTAVEFDQAYASIGANSPLSSLLNDFTLAIWVKPSSLIRSGIICFDSEARGWSLAQNNANATLTINDVGTVAINDVFASNVWTHLAFTLDYKNNLTWFVNGQKQSGATQMSSPVKFIASETFVGKGLDQDYFDGSIDEIYLYDGVLSDASIFDLAIPEPTLAIWTGLLALLFFRKK